MSKHVDDQILKEIISQVGKEPKQLKRDNEGRIVEIAFRGEGLTRFPSKICQLKNLTYLSLSENRLTSIPASIGKLQKLTTLYLYSNQLTRIPQGIGKLRNLTGLSLSSNQLTDIPESIGKLQNLTTLYLYNNQLTSIPEDIGKLQNLTILDLNSNGLTSIPGWLAKKDNLTRLHVRNNPLRTPPPEIAYEEDWKDDSNLPRIRGYFRELERADTTDRLFEVKLLLVGEERAGKSTLADALSNPHYKFRDQVSTRGIDIVKWIIPKAESGLENDFRVNIWDFGGQAIYHATHQFFLTRRSLYFLVYEARKDIRHDDFWYWLNTISVLADHSPVILLLNKCEQPHVSAPIQEYRDAFPNIINDLNVSCLDSERATIGLLKTTILKILTNKDLLPDIGAELPKVWVDIRSDISALKEDGRDYISYEEYLSLCETYGLSEERALVLSDYFHRLGVILHFRDSLALRDTIFLNHEWVTKGVYNVLDNQDVIGNHGHFTDNDLVTIWSGKEYQDKRPHLVHLMEKFEICFNITSGEYLAPQLLLDDVPESLGVFDNMSSLKDTLHYEYRYKFMPRGILARLIVKMHQQIHEQTNWRSGVVFAFDNARALVRERYFERRITFVITGMNKQQLLGTIRTHLEEIHRSFPSLKVEEMVPCNCTDCKIAEKPFFYRAVDLMRRLRKGKLTVGCEISYVDVEVQSILGNAIIPTYDREGQPINNVSFNYFERAYDMRIGKVDVHGNANFADRIDKIEYNENLGVSKEDLTTLVEAVKSLSTPQKKAFDAQCQGFIEAETDEEKQSYVKKIGGWLVDTGIDVGKSVTTELMKAWLGM